MAKGRFSRKVVATSKGPMGRIPQSKIASKNVTFRRRTFQVKESQNKPKIKRRSLGGFAFQMKDSSNLVEAADVAQTGQEHFYSPIFPTDLLEKPVNEAQARVYYAHFYEHDPFVGRAIDLHCELPISKIRLKVPDAKDKDKARKILKFYEEMCRRLRLHKRLREITLEYWLYGSSWPFQEWDENQKVWRSITLMNQDALEVANFPYTNFSRVSITPSQEDSLLLQQARANPEDESLQAAIEDIPEDIVARIESGDKIPLDTDPYAGSYVYHLARRKLVTNMTGVSILKRVLDTLIYRDKLRQAQSMIASRSMTPKNLVWADGMSDQNINDLREQVDLAIADPDFSIVSNFQITWEQIGAEGRLLDLGTEYDYTETLLCVGLGVTRELLTGEGTFSGNRVGLEIMNNSYMSLRDDLIEYVEEFLFRPVAVANGFFEEDEEGNKVYLYPKLTFTRLALRDNVDTFDMLFNLYQKGSLDISVILDLLNIDPVDTKDKLQQDLFTVNDSIFNELLRSMYTEAARVIVERSDIVQRLSKSMGVKLIKPAEGEESTVVPIDQALSKPETPSEQEAQDVPSEESEKPETPAEEEAKTPETTEETPAKEPLPPAKGESSAVRSSNIVSTNGLRAVTADVKQVRIAASKRAWRI